MKICRPIKHLPKHLRRLYKLFLKHTEPQIQSFLIEEMANHKPYEFAKELQEKEYQKSLKN